MAYRRPTVTAVANKIYRNFLSPKKETDLKRVWLDYEPANDSIRMSNIGEVFGYTNDENDIVRSAIDLLENGWHAIEVTKDPKSESIVDSHGGVYPAEIEHTAELR